MTVEAEALKPYFGRREELSVHAGCVLWGSRVVITPQGREEVLNLLHESHPGIVKMKNLARSYVLPLTLPLVNHLPSYDGGNV